MKSFSKFLIYEEKINLTLIFFAGLLLTFLETIGIGSIGFYALVIIDPETLYSKIEYDPLLNFIKQKSQIYFISLRSVLLILIFLIKNLYIIFYTYLETEIFKKILIRNSLKIYNIYLERDYIYHIKNNPQKLINNINSTLKMAINYLFLSFALFREFLFIIILVGGLFFFNWKFSLLVFFVLGIISYLIIFFLKEKISQYGLKIIESGKDILKNLNEGIRSIKFSKLLKSFSFLIKDYKKSIFIRENNQQKHSILTKFPKLILEVSSILILVLTSIFLVITIEEKSQVAAYLTIISLIFIRMIPTFINLNTLINNLKFFKPAFNIIIEEFDKEIINQDISQEKKFNLNEKIISNFLIEFKNINYEYELNDEKKSAVKNVSIQINNNELIGIAGPSGSGKTTLIDIIAGLLKPSSGKIMINGDEVNLFNNSRWQNLISYVPQDTILNNATILENIAYGIEKDKIDFDLINNCINKSQLNGYIDNLPDGVLTVIEDLGKNLSGGQKQRIGLARALYREPKILILDEFTSSLDATNEKMIMQDLTKMNNMTLIIIAHKFTSIQNCDKVYYFESGKLIKQGLPQDLKNYFYEN